MTKLAETGVAGVYQDEQGRLGLVSDRKMTNEQQDTLEQLVDACGLDLVLTGLANICALKSDHLGSNWQDDTGRKAWLRAMTACDRTANHKDVVQVSG